MTRLFGEKKRTNGWPLEGRIQWGGWGGQRSGCDGNRIPGLAGITGLAYDLMDGGLGWAYRRCVGAGFMQLLAESPGAIPELVLGTGGKRRKAV